MSHTNQTPNYHLPQFIGTDKPAWLVDFNQAMSDIDTQMKANETASATAEANAQSALSGLTATNAQVGGLQTDVSAIQTQMPLDEAQIASNTQNISTQASAIVNANNRIDTLNGKVGDLADLDTTDKTSIVNAVNELNADINKGYVEVESDGVKTYGQLFIELFALIDRNKITNSAVLENIGSDGSRTVFNARLISATQYDFNMYEVAVGTFNSYTVVLSATGPANYGVITTTSSTSFANYTSSPVAIGRTFRVYY